MNKEPSFSNQINDLLSPCTKILPNGFAIDLTADTAGWCSAVRQYGGRSLCDAVAAWLCAAYREQFKEAFLFSENCISFEFRYHLYTYLWTQGIWHIRPLTTLLFTRERLIRSCHSVEIDLDDVYRWTQRIVFRYFFGVRKEYKCSPRDPYASSISGRLRRIPFMKKRRTS